MARWVLAFNVGSSTLKCALFDADAPDATPGVAEADLAKATWHCTGILAPSRHTLPPPDSLPNIALALLDLTRQLPGTLVAILHRFVMGGPVRQTATELTPEVLTELAGYAPLCPLHQPPALAVAKTLSQQAAGLPQWGIFDTAFHVSQSPLEKAYALPASLRQAGVQRYGFHGISCQSILRQLQHQHPDLAEGRLVIAHLGSGASLTAVHRGVSVATTMGFSTLDGVPMGTRPGNLDPGVVLYLLDHGWTRGRLSDLLYHQSGLCGLSGESGDVRALLASGSEEARFALDSFCYQVARATASLACPMAGIDTLVFTAGIGEHQPVIRAEIARNLAWLGLQLDAEANQRHATIISSSNSRPQAMVLATDETREMLLQVLPCLPPCSPA